MANLKNIGYRMFVLGLAMTTAFTTIALTDIGKTSVNADVERVPFYSSQSGDNLFEVDSFGDLNVAVIRKNDGSGNGPLGFCLNKTKRFPSDGEGVDYYNTLDPDWTWDLGNGTSPSKKQVEQVQRILYGYKFIFNDSMERFGLDANDTMSLYHATQIALWAVIEGFAPTDVKIKEGVSGELLDLAEKIHLMMIEIYNYGVNDSLDTFVTGIKVTLNDQQEEFSSYAIESGDYFQSEDGSGYYRSPLLEAIPKQLYGYLYEGDYAFTYEVTPGEDSPKGTRIVNEYGHPQTTFSTADGVGLEFFVETPADAVIGQSGEYSVDITTTMFRRYAPVLWDPVSETAYQTLGQIAAIPDHDSKTIQINYGGIGDLASITVIKKGEQVTTTKSVKTEYGNMEQLMYETAPLQGTGFEVYIRRADNGSPFITGSNGVEYVDGAKIRDEIGYTGENGKVTFNALPFIEGTDKVAYDVKETTPSAGYELGDEVLQSVILSKDKSTGTLSYENARVPLTFSFVKKGKTENGSTKPLEGVTFGIYTEKPYMNSYVEIKKDTLIGLVESDKNGIVSSGSIELPIDGRFYIRELKTDADYELDDTLAYLNTDSNEIQYKNGTYIVDVTDKHGNVVSEWINELKGQAVHVAGLSIDKQIEDYINGKITYRSITADEAKDFAFELYTDEALTQRAAVINVDDFRDGRFRKELDEGFYYLVETKAPDGFIKQERLKVAVSNDAADLVIKNERNVTDITFRKLDNTDTKNLKPMESVRFDLMLDGYLLASVKTDKNGYASIKNLKTGFNYELIENVPSGYASDQESISIDLREKTSINDFVVYNHRSDKTGSIEIIKKDGDSGVTLRGVEFTLYRYSDRNYQKPLDTQTTDSSGRARFIDLPEGRYRLVETKAKSGYEAADETIIDLTGIKQDTWVTETIYNYKISADIIVHKIDADTGEGLKNAKIGLYKNLKNDPIAYQVTDSKGKARFSNLKAGTYYVKEMRAPSGYELNGEAFKVNLTGKQDEAEVVTIENESIQSDLIIIKRDNDTNVKLSGAEFRLYDKSDTDFRDPIVTITTGEDGKATLKNLIHGRFVLVETKAPLGYVRYTGDIDIDLTDVTKGKDVTVNVYNSKKTSDPDVPVVIGPIIDKPPVIEIPDTAASENLTAGMILISSTMMVVGLVLLILPRTKYWKSRINQ